MAQPKLYIDFILYYLYNQVLIDQLTLLLTPENDAMKKIYKAPQLNTTPLELGVFGDYGDLTRHRRRRRRRGGVPSPLDAIEDNELFMA